MSKNIGLVIADYIIWLILAICVYKSYWVYMAALLVLAYFLLYWKNIIDKKQLREEYEALLKKHIEEGDKLFRKMLEMQAEIELLQRLAP